MCSQNLDAAAEGESSRSDFASLMTANVDASGLELVPDFGSQEEAEAFVAVLTGPQRETSCPTLRQCLDCETAEVLRGIQQKKVPIVCLDLHSQSKVENVKDYIQTSVSKGRGRESLAGVIVRTWQHNFSSNLFYHPIVMSFFKLSLQFVMQW